MNLSAALHPAKQIVLHPCAADCGPHVRGETYMKTARLWRTHGRRARDGGVKP